MSVPELLPVLAGAEDVFVVHGKENIAAFDLLIDDLGRRCGAPVTGRWAWVGATVEQEGLHSSALLLAAAGDLRGAVVFVHHVDTAGVRHVRLASGGDGHRAFLLAVDEAAAVALGVALADTLTATDGPTRVELGPLPAGDPTLESLLLSLPGTAEVDCRHDVVPVVRKEGADLDDYLSHGVRRTLRKSNNRLTTDGVRAEFTVTSDAEEIIARLPEIAAVSRARDHAGGRSSLLDDETGMQRWIQRLIGLARLCRLELSTLLLDGEPAAYVLGIEDNGAYRVLEGRYVMTWKRYAPGRLLEAHVLERMLGRTDLHELDWMTSVAPETLLAANGGVDVVTADLVL